MIIGLSGLIGSGKSTVADYLESRYGFEKIAFADTLKDVCAALFGWDRALLEGGTPESRAWRDQPDAYWTQALQRTVTPRWALQNIGTDIMREQFDDYVWIYSLYQKLLRADGNIVVTDCRFFNELDVIKLAGGTLWSVHRGPRPSWWATAVAHNALYATDRSTGAESRLAQRRDHLACLGVHPSEYSWAGYDFAAQLDNNGTVDELYSLVDQLLKTECEKALKTP